MKTITIKSWPEFDRTLSKKHYRKWIFRGQSDATWNMESSLHRAFEEAQEIHKTSNNKEKNLNKEEHEKVMIDRFKCSAHLYLNSLPKDDDILSWLSLMQHHGAPTRLLDFTFSYYIALYFALEYGEDDAAVYCINHQAIKNDDDEQFGSKRHEMYAKVLDEHMNSDEPFLLAFEPTFSNQRLLSQQGLFVAINNHEYTHENLLTAYELEDDDVLKFIIPKKLRYSGLRKLNQMNINSTNIYPGLDGFCKSLRRQPIFGLEFQRRVGKEL
jgi:hypothetical protein